MKKLLLLLIIATGFAFGQDDNDCKANSDYEVFPGNLLFQPLTANFLEPRMGFQFTVSQNDLRLDVGNSMDIIQYSLKCGTSFSAGADFFTYTMLRGESDFHFPVDAVDYLFGLNFAYQKPLKNAEIGGRLRISHISAHFVDGHYDNPTGRWYDNRGPIVYSREFVELIQYYKYKGLRGYAGFTYLFHVDPADINKDIYQLGFDYYAKGLLTEHFTPFAGYDLRAIDISEGYYNHSVSLGIKYGNANGRGFSIYYNYYSGKSIHGEYFDVDREYSAIGIMFDL